MQTQVNVVQEIPTELDSVALPQQLPPVIITAFTRPDLLEPTLAAIAQQSLQPETVIAFVDGARHERDVVLIEDCITLLKNFETPKRKVEIIQRETNMGCDKNVIAAFDQVLSTYDSLVYIEDDDLPNPHFYDRICRLLEVYKNSSEIFSVSGYVSLALPVEEVQEDFLVSQRVFSWGFGIWSDRWKAMDLAHKSGQYNPYGSFYKIPVTKETKMTLVNQFWLEKNQKTDWVITMTLFALSQGKVHLVPKSSIVKNIGFGHAQSETYRGREGDWVNARYDATFRPNNLPASLELHDLLSAELTGKELAQFLKAKKIWLTPAALAYYLRKYPSPQCAYAWISLFFNRLSTLVGRWKSGLRI
jgi:glycosyltransferase involved in cell wall biosynthesis